MSIDDADKQSANPKFVHYGEEGYTEANEPYHRNCGTCVQAYELRRRGHDFTAKGLDITRDDSPNYIVAKDPFRPWKNIDGTKPTPAFIMTVAFFLIAWATALISAILYRGTNKTSETK